MGADKSLGVSHWISDSMGPPRPVGRGAYSSHVYRAWTSSGGEEAQDLHHLGGLLRSRHRRLRRKRHWRRGARTTFSIRALRRNSTIRRRLPPRWANPVLCCGAPSARTANSAKMPNFRRTWSAASPRKTPIRPPANRREPPPQGLDDKAARKAALAFEKEQKRCEADRRSEEKATQKAGERRDRAIAAVQAALEEAEQEHRATVQQIDRDRAAPDRKSTKPRRPAGRRPRSDWTTPCAGHGRRAICGRFNLAPPASVAFSSMEKGPPLARSWPKILSRTGASGSKRR